MVHYSFYLAKSQTYQPAGKIGLFEDKEAFRPWLLGETSDSAEIQLKEQIGIRIEHRESYLREGKYQVILENEAAHFWTRKIALPIGWDQAFLRKKGT